MALVLYKEYFYANLFDLLAQRDALNKLNYKEHSLRPKYQLFHYKTVLLEFRAQNSMASLRIRRSRLILLLLQALNLLSFYMFLL